MNETKDIAGSPFLAALRGRPHDRVPVWFMRQAGRALPGYRALRERHGFAELLRDPELAAEVTLMPRRELGVDALIFFGDILVVPEALGMELEWTDRGPRFRAPLAALDDPASALRDRPERLEPALRTVERVLADPRRDVPLIGFCGAPMTVLCYMLAGSGRGGDFSEAVRFFYAERAATARLLDAVVAMSVHYAAEQAARGVHAFQLFESNAGAVPLSLYRELFLPAAAKVCAAVRAAGIPVVFFPRGIGAGLSLATPDLCDCAGVDWQTPIREARRLVHPEVALQGNLDPRLLLDPASPLDEAVDDLLRFGAERDDWVFGLGHGVAPGTDAPALRRVVDRAHGARGAAPSEGR